MPLVQFLILHFGSAPGPFTSIQNPSFANQNSGGWQATFDDADFQAAFSSSSQAVGDGQNSGLDTNDPGGVCNVATSHHNVWDPMSTPTCRDSGAALASSPWSPSGTTTVAATSAPPSLATAAPMVHIRDLDETSKNVSADLCSLAPPPPVTVRQKADGKGISRQRPGTERGSRRLSYDLPSPDAHSTTVSHRSSLHRPFLSQTGDVALPSQVPVNEVHVTSDADTSTGVHFDPSASTAPMQNLTLAAVPVKAHEPAMDEPKSLLDITPQSPLDAPLVPAFGNATSLLDGLVESSTSAPAPTSISTGSMLATVTSSTETSDSRATDQAPDAVDPEDDWAVTDQQREYYKSQFVNLADSQDLVTGMYCPCLLLTLKQVEA